MASGQPQFRLGDPEMDRDSCPANSPGRAYLSTVRDNVVTEISLLRFSAALTCRFSQGSRKSAFRPKTHPIVPRRLENPESANRRHSHCLSMNLGPATDSESGGPVQKRLRRSPVGALRIGCSVSAVSSSR